MNTCRAKPHFAQFWCNISPFRINTCKSVSKQTTLSTFRINTYEKTGGWGPILELATHQSAVALCSSSLLSYSCALFGRIKNSTHFFSIASTLFAQKHRGGGASLLTNRLLTTGGVSHGFIHCDGGLFAEFTLALIAALKILKIILQNFRASLAQAFSGGLVQRSFSPLLGRAIRMLTELHDGSVSAPIVRILPIALALRLLVQRINQEIISRQDKRNPYDPQNHEPLEHGTETPSLKFILADFSLAQAARQRNGAHEYLDCVSMAAAQTGRWAARADNCLTIYSTFCQFPHPQPGCKVNLSQSKVRP